MKKCKLGNSLIKKEEGAVLRVTRLPTTPHEEVFSSIDASRFCGNRTYPLNPSSLPSESSTTLSTIQTLTTQTRPSIMSTSLQSTGPSTDNFTAIFKAASDEYQRVTGKRLDSHPFATQFDTCDSPEAVLTVLRTQAQAFSSFCKGDETLMTWLDPTIRILSMLSATLGGIGLVSLLIHFA